MRKEEETEDLFVCYLSLNHLLSYSYQLNKKVTGKEEGLAHRFLFFYTEPIQRLSLALFTRTILDNHKKRFLQVTQTVRHEFFFFFPDRGTFKDFN